MSSNIQNIVARHIPAEYRSRPEVLAVVRDLTAARDNAASLITRAASSAGVDSAQVRSLLIEAGLVERPAPVVTTPAAAPAAASAAGDGVVERLVAFARQHGFRG